MRGPDISVVIPAHDPGERLRLALEDVQAQSVGSWECVVVDDGSAEDLSWVAELDERITLHRQPNAGVSVARNEGVRLTSGSLVAFLDQDDRWDRDRLERSLITAREHPDAAFWSSGFRWDLPDESQTSSYPDTGSLTWFLAEGGACQSAVTVRREDYLRLGGQRPDLRMCQDFEFALRLLRPAGSVVVIDSRATVTYVVHGGNASSNYWLTAREFRMVYREQARAARAAGRSDVVRAARRGLRVRSRTQAFQAIDVARAAWRRGDRRATVTAILRGVRCSPRVLARESTKHALRAVGARWRRAPVGRVGPRET